VGDSKDEPHALESSGTSGGRATQEGCLLGGKFHFEDPWERRTAQPPRDWSPCLLTVNLRKGVKLSIRERLELKEMVFNVKRKGSTTPLTKNGPYGRVKKEGIQGSWRGSFRSEKHHLGSRLGVYTDIFSGEDCLKRIGNKEQQSRSREEQNKTWHPVGRLGIGKRVFTVMR